MYGSRKGSMYMLDDDANSWCGPWEESDRTQSLRVIQILGFKVSATRMFTRGADEEEGDAVLSWCEDDGQEDSSDLRLQASGRVQPTATRVATL
jgi:hypothetical protein